MPEPQLCGISCISKVDNTATTEGERERETTKKMIATTNFPFSTVFFFHFVHAIFILVLILFEQFREHRRYAQTT